MSEAAKKITREELHSLLWTRPLVRLTKELGYSYNELVAICTAFNIPRPSGGYWYRQAHGGAEDPTPLPPAEPGKPVAIPFGPRYGQVDQPVVITPPEPEAPAPAAEDVAAPEKQKRKPGPEDAASSKAEPAAATVKLPTKVEYTREQLHEAVWSKSGVKLAAELGLSDVGLAKTCRRLGIPRPPRGYWARIASGEKLRRPALPAIQPGQNNEVTFYVAANMERRQEWALNTIPSAMAGVRCATVELPPPGAEPHPIAERHRLALEKARQGDMGFVSAKGKNLFRCEMSISLVPRFVRALDALLWELEDRDYEFKAGSHDQDGLRISLENDNLTLQWSEAKLEVVREPTAEDRRKPSWTWQLKETKPAGELSIEVSATGLKGKRKWTSGEGRTLEEVLGVIVGKVEAAFRGFERQRQREAEFAKQCAEVAKRRAEAEAREAEREAEAERERKEQERLQRHRRRLAGIAEARRNNLLMATHDWMEARCMGEFLSACEERWRRAEGGHLSPKQQEWLAWARAEVEKLEPFALGYPDPGLDGSFPASEVPQGGPYPETREWPQRERQKSEAKPTPQEPQRPPMAYPHYLSTGWKD